MKKLMIGVVLGLALFVLPAATQAAGLIPCGGEGQSECQSCHVVTLANNVIGWLVGALGVIAVMIIVYAGVKLVTANGNHHALQEAKGMMTNLLIGYLIVLGGWLMMDYIMKALVVDAPTFGMWNEISCVKQPEVNKFVEWSNPDKDLVGVAGWVAAPAAGSMIAACTLLPGPPGAMEYDCTKQQAECIAKFSTPVVSAAGDTVTCNPKSYGSKPPDLSAGGVCALSVVSPYFDSVAGSAQCIIKHESVCGARMVSTSDVMRNDGNRAFSFGPMQINLTWHDLVGCGPGGSTLRCTQAFNGKNYTATVKDEALYQQCAEAAQNVACNLRNGRLIYNAGFKGVKPSWGAWSTAADCGLK